MWSPMAAALAKDHTVVVPDLRGMGLSSHPAGGYDKWTQAGDIRAVLNKPASTAPTSWPTTSVRGCVCLRGALPGQDKPTGRDGLAHTRHPAWDQIVAPARGCGTLTSAARTPERLVAGRERIYLDDSGTSSPATRPRSTKRPAATMLRSTLKPGAMHSAFAQFRAIHQKDEADKPQGDGRRS